jgi:hypothetical protein
LTSLEMLWWHRRRIQGGSFAAQAVLRELEADPAASNREIGARTRPYPVGHPFVADVRSRYRSGDLVAVPSMLATLDGKPTGDRLEALLQRRRDRLAARGRP